MVVVGVVVGVVHQSGASPRTRPHPPPLGTQGWSGERREGRRRGSEGARERRRRRTRAGCQARRVTASGSEDLMTAYQQRQGSRASVDSPFAAFVSSPLFPTSCLPGRPVQILPILPLHWLPTIIIAISHLQPASPTSPITQSTLPTSRLFLSINSLTTQPSIHPSTARPARCSHYNNHTPLPSSEQQGSCCLIISSA